MDRNPTKSILETVKDFVLIAIKTKFGLYSKNPVGAVTDAKDVVDDIKDIVTDIKEDKPNEGS